MEGTDRPPDGVILPEVRVDRPLDALVLLLWRISIDSLVYANSTCKMPFYLVKSTYSRWLHYSGLKKNVLHFSTVTGVGVTLRNVIDELRIYIELLQWGYFVKTRVPTLFSKSI